MYRKTIPKGGYGPAGGQARPARSATRRAQGTATPVSGTPATPAPASSPSSSSQSSTSGLDMLMTMSLASIFTSCE